MKETKKEILTTKDELRVDAANEFTAAHGEKIKSQLLNMSREGHESLDLTNISAMDVVGIQLAYAWRKALLQNKRKGTVMLAESENIKDLFTKTGITQIL